MKTLNEIALAELERTISGMHTPTALIKATGLGFEAPHVIDLDLLRDLVALAKGYDAEITANRSEAYDEGYNEGALDYDCDCDD